MLAILRGDDTDFQELRTIFVTLKDFSFPLTNCVGRFILCGQVVTISSLTPNTDVPIKFTHEQTEKMPLGIQHGKFCVIDANNRIRTFDSSIRVLVSDSAEEVYGIIQKGNGVSVYGSVDYNSLKNLPSIGGHEVKGKLTYGDLGIVARINKDYAPNSDGDVRIPRLILMEEKPNTEAVYESEPEGYLESDVIFAKQTNRQYVLAQVADGNYRWIEVVGGLTSVTWEDIEDKPLAGEILNLRTDDEVYAAIKRIIEIFGGTVNE